MPDAKAEDSPLAFLTRFFNAVLRILAAGVVGFLHWALSKGIPYVISEKFVGLPLFLEGVSAICFSIVYVYLLWEMLKVFIPWIPERLKSFRGTPDHDQPVS